MTVTESVILFLFIDEGNYLYPPTPQRKRPSSSFFSFSFIFIQLQLTAEPSLLTDTAFALSPALQALSIRDQDGYDDQFSREATRSSYRGEEFHWLPSSSTFTALPYSQHIVQPPTFGSPTYWYPQHAPGPVVPGIPPSTPYQSYWP